MARGYFRPEVLKGLVDDHLEARVDRGRSLWTLLALEVWHRLFVDDDGSDAAAGRLGERLTGAVAGAILSPGDEVLLPAPYWTTYPETIALAGGVSVVLQTTEATGFKVADAAERAGDSATAVEALTRLERQGRDPALRRRLDAQREGADGEVLTAGTLRLNSASHQVSAGSAEVALGFGQGDLDLRQIRPGDKLWKTSDPELDRRLQALPEVQFVTDVEKALPVERRAKTPPSSPSALRKFSSKRACPKASSTCCRACPWTAASMVRSDSCRAASSSTARHRASSSRGPAMRRESATL